MSFLSNIKQSVSRLLYGSPEDAALLYRGRRVVLRREYETTINPVRRLFLKNVLIRHTELMAADYRPVRSYLWKAEKADNSVFLFGDIHRTLQPIFWEIEGDDIIPTLKGYIHPDVWQAFISSEKFYVENFCAKHAAEIAAITAQLDAEYKIELSPDPLADLSLEPLCERKALLGPGLVDYMLAVKTGIVTQDYGTKLDGFVQEMEDMPSTKETMELVYQLLQQGILNPHCEKTLEELDAMQMGNLESLTLLQSGPKEYTDMIENRNAKFVDFVIHALERGEQAFFAPGASHFIGERGILRLLEQQGVTITRVPLI